MFLAFCLLGVRRHDGAQECAISFPFPSLLVWGSQKWEGTRDSLAKRVGECVIIAFFSWAQDLTFWLGLQAGLGVRIYAERVRASAFFSLSYRFDSFWCAKTAFRAVSGLRQSPSLTFPCRTSQWAGSAAAAPLQRQRAGGHAGDGQYSAPSEPVAQSQAVSSLWFPPSNRANWIFASTRSNSFQFPLPGFLPSLTKARYCWPPPACSSATYFLLRSRSDLAPVCNRGFWAHMNLATVLSSLTEVNATNWVIRGSLLCVKRGLLGSFER